MRIMAFDYGTKRIGLAVTDPQQIIASALTTVQTDSIWDYLKEYLENKQVESFVVGKPMQLDGTDSQSAQHVVGFIRKLRKTYPHITIHQIDERFTSKIASRAISQSGMKKHKRQDKQLIDQVSAVLILQSFMDTKSF